MAKPIHPEHRMEKEMSRLVHLLYRKTGILFWWWIKDFRYPGEVLAVLCMLNFPLIRVYLCPFHIFLPHPQARPHPHSPSRPPLDPPAAPNSPLLPPPPSAHVHYFYLRSLSTEVAVEEGGIFPGREAAVPVGVWDVGTGATTLPSASAGFTSRAPAAEGPAVGEGER